MWGYDHGSGLMGVGMLVWLVPIALIIWLFIRNGENSGRGEKKGPSPREILDERYARGEIDRDEYLARRSDLDDVSKI